jgi:pyruvate formate-lyase activating enzyme-like uncharacterized protein
MDKNVEWRSKMQEVFQVCQDELKKTTEIGKRMLSASKTNSTLHESYEELGVLLVDAIKTKKIVWDDERVQSLIKRIDGCESDLENIEDQVNKIRFSENAEAAKDDPEK